MRSEILRHLLNIEIFIFSYACVEKYAEMYMELNSCCKMFLFVPSTDLLRIK